MVHNQVFLVDFFPLRIDDFMASFYTTTTRELNNLFTLKFFKMENLLCVIVVILVNQCPLNPPAYNSRNNAGVR